MTGFLKELEPGKSASKKKYILNIQHTCFLHHRGDMMSKIDQGTKGTTRLPTGQIANVSLSNSIDKASLNYTASESKE